MLKKYKSLKSLLLLVFAILVTAPLMSVKANSDVVYTNTTRTEVVYRYTIEAYDVLIDVKENNVLEITESIKANFKEPRHGIIRKIPLRNTVKRNDGSVTKNSVRLTDLSVSEEYEDSNDSGYRVIKIGDADETITGIHDYVIRYSYNLGKDSSKDFDELYFNIIGDEWDTEINNVTFTINMPKEFDVSKLGFSSGKYGTVGSNDVEYTVEGNKIVGSLKKKLDREEALTVRCELPEGYFVNAGIKLPLLFPLMFIVPLIAAIIAYLMWSKYGRDDVVVETVEFYPPNGCNSAEAAYFYKTSVSEKDANSLLIYLASKGYLKIVEIDKNNYKIIKLKEYDGNNSNEKLFMDGLFKSKNEVTKDDLYNKFYKTIEKIKLNIDNYKNKALIYDSKASSMRVYAVLLAALSVIVTVSIPTFDYGLFSDVFVAIMFGSIMVLILAVELYSPIHVAIKIMAVIPTLIIGLFMASELPIYYAASANNLTLIAIIFGLVMALVVCFFVRYMSKRTPYGNEMYGRVKGFRNFLVSAEKDKLEALVNDDPTYFYSILPFTYVLGVSDKWIKKFEGMTLEEPDWYESNTPFSIYHFNTFLSSTMSSTVDRVVETSSGGSSGGFSGGGFSGGGSGGGGGSSW